MPIKGLITLGLTGDISVKKSSGTDGKRLIVLNHAAAANATRGVCARWTADQPGEQGGVDATPVTASAGSIMGC